MKKRFIILCIAMIFLSGCKKYSLEANELKQINFVLDYSINPNHVGIFVADKLGYFNDEGIKVNILKGPDNGADLVVASKSADFGISYQDSLALNYSSDNPLPVIAVSSIIAHNDSGLISLSKSNIKNPKDMENHTYATWNMEVEKMIIYDLMKSNGSDYNKLKILPFEATNVLASLNSGADLVWVYYYVDGIILNMKNIDFNYIKLIDYKKEYDYYTPLIIGNNEFIEKNPIITKKFLKALKKGYMYAMDNPKESAKILHSYAKELDIKYLEESLEYLKDKWIDKDFLEEGFGYIDEKRWNLFFEFLYKNNIISKDITKEKYFTNDFLD